MYISKELVEVQICWQLVLCCSSSHAALRAVFMCCILRTETKKSLRRLLSSNFKSQNELLLVTWRYWALFFYTENHFSFLGHLFLKYRRSSCIWLRLISNLISNALLFLTIKHCFSDRGLIEYFYFSAVFRLNMYLWIFCRDTGSIRDR